MVICVAIHSESFCYSQEKIFFLKNFFFRSVGQFSRSVVSDSLWPLDCSTLGLPVHHQLPEFTQTHVHWVHDAIQLSHPVIPFSFCLQSFNFSDQNTLKRYQSVKVHLLINLSSHIVIKSVGIWQDTIYEIATLTGKVNTKFENFSVF